MEVKKSAQVFESEWIAYDYESPSARTFGGTEGERYTRILRGLGLSPSELHGKLVLDAGCGNGVMAKMLSEVGVRMVAMDIADLRRAKKYIPGVAFVRGNVLYFPFKSGVFDHAYSHGVLHHTRSTREAFDKISVLVRPGGRLYVWLYRLQPCPKYLHRKLARAFVTRLSVSQQLWFFRHVWVRLAEVKGFLGGRMLFDKAWHDRLQMGFFDGLAVPFQHKHSVGEVERWFQEDGYNMLHLSNIGEFGFGMTGVRR